ncbi:thioredoxin domain-containing protein [Deltaproteobacteria bacterium]|nr:thioredoxin domain-containing protein [Deltaproteobacteria bacterium]
MTNTPNRLIHEKSPYLLQHAHNPVDWYPWGDEAFERSLRDNKPIFLSIGYSTCHWCHVMERESFEDKEVAGLMNDAFISIKVDREERPDLDHVYMTVCQMVAGSGGWPLTIIMTPDKKPFFAGTYIPRTSRFGRTGMIELIPRIKEIWDTRYNEVAESAEKIIEALQGMAEVVPGQDMDASVLDNAYNELASRFDKEHGGFGGAPKFPTAHNLLFLLRYWRRTGNEQPLQIVEKTLGEIRKGGMYDHIGFGFHRYSTDRKWLVPHFEKMLYDQALLAIAYLEAYQATGAEDYGGTAKEIFDYVLRDMTSPLGGFYSAEDADSEGEEGKFYVWKEEEIVDVLEKDEADIIKRVFNIEKNGNFRDEASGRNTGTNIFHLQDTLTGIAVDLKMTPGELEYKISSARKRLFENRDKRIHPHKDDKILTDWNGLMIAAFSRGAQLFEKREYLEAAVKASNFILNSMRGPDCRLLHRYRDGSAGITANLDDFAFMVWGLIELYETVFDSGYLKPALDLNQDMISRFRDENKGGFFFTPDDGEKLIIRKKEVYDGALPSGNSVAMLNILRLARITGRSDLEEMAAEIGRAFSNEIKQHPSAFTYFMTAVDFSIGPSYEVVIAGNPEKDDTRKMLKALRRNFTPNKVTIMRSSEEAEPGIDSLAGFVKNHGSIDGRATAYVCVNNSCKAPTTEVERMLESVGILVR